jgi:hypothetical protein
METESPSLTITQVLDQLKRYRESMPHGWWEVRIKQMDKQHLVVKVMVAGEIYEAVIHRDFEESEAQYLASLLIGKL